MRFLVTNDDGVDSIFLRLLVEGLQTAGHELFVAAPKTEQSWIGAAKSRSRPVRAHTEDKQFGCPTWIIDGTPSDCVNIAMDHLVPNSLELDAVVSGINIGMNATLGFIIASGTVSGALEGALHGLPSVALSQNLSVETFEKIKHADGRIDETVHRTLQNSARHAAQLIPALVRETAPRSFVVHNLNFPEHCTAESRMVRTVPAHVVVPRLFTAADGDGLHRMTFNYGEDCSPEGLLTDRLALAQGLISHSILDYRRLGMIPSQ
jgi:5'-nucleotidase